MNAYTVGQLVEFQFSSTQAGRPAAWERGGGFTSTGDAVIVAGADGAPKRPAHVRRSGHLACDKHALLPVVPGDHLIFVRHGRSEDSVTVMVIESLTVNDGATPEGTCRVVAVYRDGAWKGVFQSMLVPAVEAARAKARCYHCREPHYVA